MSTISMLSETTKGRAMSCCSHGRGIASARDPCGVTSDWAAFCATTFERRRDGAADQLFDRTASEVQPRAQNQRGVKIQFCIQGPLDVFSFAKAVLFSVEQEISDGNAAIL